MKWLWSLFSSFYLIAYTFWIPTLFDNLLIAISLSALTITVGGGLLLNGLWRALELERNQEKMPQLPRIRVWWLIGGILLLVYLLVYIPPEGRIVAHWPLDLAITLIAGIIAMSYSVKEAKVTK